ncbi:MAG: hypothetical protein SWE60_16435 [Thermodesulfobacteriota bacterium]|nr:hypothetical protein [Thermodesulfobacteriota bacterium]
MFTWSFDIHLSMQRGVVMATSISEKDLCEMASRWLPAGQDPRRLTIHRDTTDFFGVEYGDIVDLDGRAYLIRHNAKEGRFGLDDEVKYWVKRAIDLIDGSHKVIKLVFHERFKAHIGGIEFDCFRSPRKEARILDLVSGHKNFMQGYAVHDEKENVVRVLDFIYGPSLDKYVQNLQGDHESYYFDEFPGILDRFIECVQAIQFLHHHGEKHGDIRRDHILVDRENGDFRWIDFDFNYRHRENIYGYDLFGLGNVLAFLAGMGDVLLQDLNQQDHPALGTLREEDLNIVFRNRVVNLKKVFPYIPDALNRVFQHFSKGANRFYETTGELLEDLEAFKAAQQ